MSSPERERIKRAAGIGNQGTNDLNQNAFSVATYVYINGLKHQVYMLGTLYMIRVAPGQNASGETIEKVRENAEELLAAMRIEYKPTITWDPAPDKDWSGVCIYLDGKLVQACDTHVREYIAPL